MSLSRANGTVVGLLALALVLRLIGLATRPLTYDDAFSFFLASRSFPEIVSGTAADTMPPLYYFLLHLWIQLGTGVWFLRLLNVILSLGVVAATYVLLSRLADRRVGSWGAFLVAISPIQISQAQELRMYVPLSLCLLVHSCLLLDSSRPDLSRIRRRWTSLGAVAFGSLAMYTHNLAIFSLAALPLAFIIARRWEAVRMTLRVDLGVGALALPWLIVIPQQIAKIESAFWTERPGFLEAVQALVQAHASLPLPVGFLPAALACSVVAFVLVTYETIRAGQGRQGRLVLSTIALAPPILLGVASYIMRPVFVPRSFVFSVIGYFGLAALAITYGRASAARGLVLGAFVLASGISLPYQYTYQQFPRSPFPLAVEYLRQAWKPGDVVVHDNKLSHFPMAYYAPELRQQFLADEPGSPNDTLARQTQRALNLYAQDTLEEATSDAARVWFVVFDRTIATYQELGLPSHPHLAWLDEHFRSGSHVSFGDLSVYEFLP